MRSMAITWTDPRTWLAGEKDTATLRNDEIRDNFSAIGGAWASYTPSLTSSGTAPAPTSEVGAYIHVGRLVVFRFEITMSATVGTGNYSIALPTAMAAYHFPTSFVWVTCYDTSASSLVPRIGFMTGSATVFAMGDMSGTRVSATSPFTWATGDVFAGHGVYEAAAAP